MHFQQLNQVIQKQEGNYDSFKHEFYYLLYLDRKLHNLFRNSFNKCTILEFE
jgi:hypothetical protein